MAVFCEGGEKGLYQRKRRGEIGCDCYTIESSTYAYSDRSRNILVAQIVLRYDQEDIMRFISKLTRLRAQREVRTSIPLQANIRRQD